MTFKKFIFKLGNNKSVLKSTTYMFVSDKGSETEFFILEHIHKK